MISVSYYYYYYHRSYFLRIYLHKPAAPPLPAGAKRREWRKCSRLNGVYARCQTFSEEEDRRRARPRVALEELLRHGGASAFPGLHR